MLTQAGSSTTGEIHTEIVSRAVQKRISKNYHKANQITQSFASRLKLDVTPVTYKHYSQFGYDTVLPGASQAPALATPTRPPPGSCWYCTRDIKASRAPSEYCSCGAASRLRSEPAQTQNSRQNATLHGPRLPFLQQNHVLERHSSVPAPNHQHRDDRLSNHHSRDFISDDGISSNRRYPVSSTPTNRNLPVPSCPSRKEAIQLLSQHQRDRILAADVDTRCRILDIFRKCETIIERLRNPAAAAKPNPARDASNCHSSDTNGNGPNQTVDTTPTGASSEDPVPLDSTTSTTWFIELDLHAFRIGIVVKWNPFHYVVTASPWLVPQLRLVFDRGKVCVPGSHL